MFFTQADCVTIGTQVMREVRMFDEKLLNKAEALYIRCRLDEAFPLFMELAGAGCGRAMYFLGEYYNHGLGSIKDRNETEARYWHGKGAAGGGGRSRGGRRTAVPIESGVHGGSPL